MKPALLLFTAALTAGCGGRPGPIQRESRAIDRDSSETLRAEIRMGAGELEIRGGSPNWMDADFTYSEPSWKPAVRYTTASGRADLTVEQPASGRFRGGGSTNKWEIRLNDSIPTDLRVRAGAGEARLDAGSIALRSLDIEMGAGELRLDLRGKPAHDYAVRIKGGAGEATIHLPRDVGVAAKVAGLIGEVDASGFIREGERWVNGAYDSAKIRIRLDIQGGVGSIHLISE
jgi:hypothetical protein